MTSIHCPSSCAHELVGASWGILGATARMSQSGFFKGSKTRLLLPGKCLPEPLARGPPRKGSRTRLLLSGNAFQRLWPRGSPRKGTRRKLLLPGNAFEALAGDPAQEKLQNKIVITWKCLQGVPPGTALEQDRSYQEMLPRGFGQGVPQERL